MSENDEMQTYFSLDGYLSLDKPRFKFGAVLFPESSFPNVMWSFINVATMSTAKVGSKIPVDNVWIVWAAF